MSNKNGNHVPNRRRNTAGKTHMLPPLNTTNNTNNQLGVSLTERQRLIPGSPAPAVLRKQQQEKQIQQYASERKPSMPNSPKITLSRCKDNDIQKCNIASFEDTMLEVTNVGGRNEVSSIKFCANSSPFADKRPSTSLSVLSAKSLVELQQSIREKQIIDGGGGLTPPPRIISVQDGHGHKVVTELVDPGAVMSAEQMHAAVSANNIPSKYKPLQPIQKRKQRS